jgi:hypothetical protein
VATADRGSLAFWPGRGSSASASDEYGAKWSWSGNLSAVDGRLGDDGVLRFEDYPNALERIATAFDNRVGGDVWLTARVGYEFCMQGTTVHTGGSHGSLHRADSLSPLFVAGGGDVRLDRTPRSVDITPLCQMILGLAPTLHPLGASHVVIRDSTDE